VSPVRVPRFVSLHHAAGLIALALALYFLFSDALSFDSAAGLSGSRPRLQVTAIFVVSAACLLTAGRGQEAFWAKLLGYASIGVGMATIWLIFRGSGIAA